MDADTTLIRVLLTVVTLLLSVTVHEYAHALAASKLGDDYAAREGRLTLNPMSHADPVGTLLFPAISAALGWGGFGWGRPVPYVPNNLTRRFSMRAGEAIIAFAGPFANLLMAILTGGMLVGFLHFGVIGYESAFTTLLHTMLVLNVVLFFFNLLPVPPLDGSKIAAWVFGRRADRLLDAIQGAGPIALLVVFVLGGRVIAPLVRALTDMITTGFAGLLA